MNAARQYTVFCKANIRPLYCSLTAASPEHTSLMISTISLHVCVFVVCFSVVMINCTPREYQLLRFARKENTHPSTGCLLTLSEKQRRAARFLALASFFFFLLLRSPLFPDMLLTLQKCCHFPHFSSPHNHQHFSLHDMKTN